MAKVYIICTSDGEYGYDIPNPVESAYTSKASATKRVRELNALCWFKDAMYRQVWCANSRGMNFGEFFDLFKNSDDKEINKLAATYSKMYKGKLTIPESVCEYYWIEFPLITRSKK